MVSGWFDSTQTFSNIYKGGNLLRKEAERAMKLCMQSVPLKRGKCFGRMDRL